MRFLYGKRGHHRDVQEVLEKEVRRLVQELQNLNDNIAKLVTAVDAVVVKLGNTINPAAVQAAADAVDAQTARLNAA